VAELSRRKSKPDEASDLQKLTIEAARYAERVGVDDDRRVVEVFRDALHLAAGPAGTLPAQPELKLIPIADDARRLPDLRRFTLATRSIYEDERYIKNAREYLRSIAERIVGGTETRDFPDCVAVGSETGWCCSGTLIAPNVVLTAGHCDRSCASRVLIGSDIDSASAVVINVAEAVRHPDYNSGGMHHDLTVLILERDVGTVTPCRIADAGAIDGAIYVRAVGFGNVDRNGSFGYGLKRQVDIPIASVSCSAITDPATYGCDADLELIAGQPFLNRDTCNGDSGGPVYIRVGAEWHLAGATSRATDNSISRCGDGGIYVRVDRYLDWIRSVPGGHWPN
jgi:secreted trypsin-like serine protease